MNELKKIVYIKITDFKIAIFARTKFKLFLISPVPTNM